jgi:LacI family transcriptional regulator
MKENTSKTATLREVAALAGTNVATASRALSGRGYSSQKMRDAVIKAAQELNFQPNLHARRLVKGRSHNSVALLSDHDLGVSSRQAFFINSRLGEQGFEVETHITPRWVHHAEEKQIALAGKVRRELPGAIISGSSLVPQAIEELQFFIQEGGVVVGYAEKIDLQCDQVPFDYSHRTYIATRHLLELGHREIGYCFHSAVAEDSFELLGFSRAMEEFGAPIQKDWIFGGGNYGEGGARLAEAFLSWPKKPTGLCIVNDASASVFITILYRNGFIVPDDISVVGFDDDPMAQYALVPLTTAKYPLEAIGRHVVEFTQSRLKGFDGPPRTVMVQSELVTRSSTAPYRPMQTGRTSPSRMGSSRTRKSSEPL